MTKQLKKTILINDTFTTICIDPKNNEKCSKKCEYITLGKYYVKWCKLFRQPAPSGVRCTLCIQYEKIQKLKEILQ